MKKLIPIIMFSIILFCTACEKAVNPIDMYDNVTSDSTIEELKEIHKNCNKLTSGGEGTFFCTSDNTVLQSITEKYNTDSPKIYVSKFLDDVTDISIVVKAPNVSDEDFNTLVDLFDKKYGKICSDKISDTNKVEFKITEPNLDLIIERDAEKIIVQYGFGWVFEE